MENGILDVFCVMNKRVLIKKLYGITIILARLNGKKESMDITNPKIIIRLIKNPS